MIISQEKSYELWLLSFIERHRAAAAVVHLHREGGLSLAASVNVPESLGVNLKFMPRGKGAPGLALECGETVMANGSNEEGAKLLGAKSAVAFPVFDVDGSIRAVVSAAYGSKRGFSDEELRAFEESGRSLPEADD